MGTITVEGTEELHNRLDEAREPFMNSVNQVMALAHMSSIANGWWENERNFGEQIALMHSELSEALEWWRKYGFEGESDHVDDMDAVTEEFADVLIRIFDTCQYFGLDLPGVLIDKMQYNLTRGYRHGGKRA